MNKFWKHLQGLQAPRMLKMVSRMLELYMCRLYLPSFQIATVKELRWFLFSKKQYTDEKLPSTKAALERMIKRANYVT